MFIVNKVVTALFEQAHTMQSIYQTTQRYFGKRVFAECLTAQGMERMTFAQMDKKTRRYAAYAQAHFKGQYVGIYAKNSPRWICAFWGLMMAGFVPVLLNTAVSAGSVHGVVDCFELKDVVVDGAYAVWRDRPDVRTASMDDMDNAPASPVVAAWADAFAVSTSGTEGAPKNYLFDGEAMCQQIRISQDVLATAPAFSCYGRKNSIKLLAFLPFYHIFGLVTLVLWFSFFGRTLVFAMDDTPQELQRACRQARVTHFFAVPIVWNTIVKRLKGEVAKQGATDKFEQAVEKSISIQKLFPRLGQWLAKHVLFKQIVRKLFGKSLVVGISGGAYCPEDTLRIVNALGYNLMNGYGSTEAAIVCVNDSPYIGDRIEAHCGKIFPSVTHTIDPQTGELILEGGTLYCAQVQDGLPVPRGEAPLHTHDCAAIDEDGNLHLLGRLDDMLIGPNGENLAPDAIELYYRDIGTEDYCVMSLQGKLLLVINRKALPGTTSDLRTALMQASKNVPLVERVHEVRLVNYPCRTAIGKANRRVLAEAFVADSLAYTTLEAEAKRQADTPEANAVRNAMANLLNMNAADIDDCDDFFVNLGGDSLQYFELTYRLSAQFQTQISYGETLPTTVEDIVKKIVRTQEGEDK